MTEVQEFEIQDPCMLIDSFYVQLSAGDDWQAWTHLLLHGDAIEFFYEAEGVWLPAMVDSWHIDDGSGNAPGMDAHYFFRIERDGKKYRFDLDRGIRVRLPAPTRAELIARPKGCEGIEVKKEGTRWTNEEWGQCSGAGTHKISGSWYCDSCAPLYRERFLSGTK